MQKITSKILFFLGQKSFRSILVVSFITVSILPILLLQFISNIRMSSNLRDSVNQLSIVNAEQMRTNLELSLDAYDDILYQLYTNDDLITYVQNIEDGIGSALNLNQLNRILGQMCYAKDNIEAVTVITPSGTAMFYDRLKASSLYSSWLDTYEIPIDEILALGMEDYQTKLLPTQFAARQGSTSNYLFHMVHRIIDHKDVNREVGVVVLSINETLLHGICSQDDSASFYFIVDEYDRVISYPNKERIGCVTLGEEKSTSADSAKELFKPMLEEDGSWGEYFSLYMVETTTGWRAVGVMDQSGVYQDISTQAFTMLMVGLLIVVVTGLLIFTITSLLSRSMNRFEAVMKKAEAGDLTAYVDRSDTFSREMSTIAGTFNDMMRQINILVDETREATSRQKDAEIRALEAQINPHFLYNILDTINWVAIDNDQLEVSRMITVLARILRYSIDNSNAIVPLRQEVEWLRQYMYLQRMRSKNSFEYSVDVDDVLLDFPIHKLLFQPFIENAIVHGFSGAESSNILMVSIKKTDRVEIRIHDNGRGMDKATLERAQNEELQADGHLGMANAIGRIRMYYGDKADISVDSIVNTGTTVTIELDFEEGE